MAETTVAALWSSLATILVGVLGWLGVRGATRQSRSATKQGNAIQKARDTSIDYNQLIDQLQEEVKGLRGDVAALLERVKSSERRALESETRRLETSRAMGAHIAALQHQVYTGGKPPPVDPPLPY